MNVDVVTVSTNNTTFVSYTDPNGVRRTITLEFDPAVNTNYLPIVINGRSRIKALGTPSDEITGDVVEFSDDEEWGVYI